MNFDLKIRNTSEQDYDMFVSWWKWFRFPPPPKQMLPNNGNDGILVLDENDVEVCAGFIYATSSPYLFWLEWVISNPKVKNRELRDQSITLLINSLSGLAKQMGAVSIYSSLKNESLVRHYEKCGFISSKGAIEMIRNV